MGATPWRFKSSFRHLKITWCSDFAYVIGLITTDGSLSNDGRHIVLVSKDLEQLHNFATIVKTRAKIVKKKSGYSPNGTYYVLQFGNVKLYNFLLAIGLHPNKSKTLKQVAVPNKYFADFLRGCLDGDGFTHSYWDKRWKASFLFYTGFTSASRDFLEWLSKQILTLFKVHGCIKFAGKSTYQLIYAKQNSIILMKNLYYNDRITCLSRKKTKIDGALSIINKQAGMLKLVDRHA